MIYLVEDDVNIRKLVCYALSKEGYKVVEFPDGTELEKALNENIPELVILDIMLPGTDGLQILRRIREEIKWKDIPVVMLTAKSSEFDIVTGLDAGADDYIPKPFGMTEFMARVRAVLRRYEKTKTNTEYKIGDLYVNPEKHIVTVSGEDITLSYKEYLLLLALLEAEGKVVNREALLTGIWGEFYDESRTLDVHIRKLRVKLKSAGEMIQTVKNIGYKLGGGMHE
ncbi:MAG: response regulator transcription factor [Clostridia bacterium]|nr:response regulator transcription factor [Clostridia bacterium]